MVVSIFYGSITPSGELVALLYTKYTQQIRMQIATLEKKISMKSLFVWKTFAKIFNYIFHAQLRKRKKQKRCSFVSGIDSIFHQLFIYLSGTDVLATFLPSVLSFSLSPSLSLILKFSLSWQILTKTRRKNKLARYY